ncbi:MAG: aminopeptidase P family protein [Muribaculaceae bacterium]|nr:aminopeptidase P family protein [Muribaculaceae bacterium]
MLQPDELKLRVAKVREGMQKQSLDAILISDNANIYYLSGRVYSGHVYVPIVGEVLLLIRRPVGLIGANVEYIHKPELIADVLYKRALPMPETIGLELDLASYTSICRLSNVFADAEIKNASPIMRAARAVKTDEELQLITRSGLRHEYVYRQIPQLYKEGMTDVKLQIEIERVSRLGGCIGQFRIAGNSMELFMAHVLCGDNADTPTPYDFAMGGAGIDPSLPVGCNGTTIKAGMTVMVDANGNYTGYMTDMTRVFTVGKVDELAIKAHACSIRICEELATMAKPGVEAKSLYERAVAIATEEGLEEFFMGHRQKAGFVGHGVGIEINELPVIAPRSKDVMAVGNVIALEPKFVIPGVGAVGIENTYAVTSEGMVCLTNAPAEMINLD